MLFQGQRVVTKQRAPSERKKAISYLIFVGVLTHIGREMFGLLGALIGAGVSGGIYGIVVENVARSFLPIVLQQFQNRGDG